MIYVWTCFSRARAAVSDGTRKDVKYAKTAAAAAAAAAKAETRLRRAGGRWPWWGFCCVNGRSDKERWGWKEGKKKKKCWNREMKIKR